MMRRELPSFLVSCLLLAGSFLLSPPCGAEPPPRPAPPGPFVKSVDPEALKKNAFRKDQPVVGTYYFYWYDVTTGEHFVDPDGTDALTDHPHVAAGYSYRSPEWHRREILDMIEAGIDFLLPVYWGYPESYTEWSFTGLPPLIEAWRRLEKEGKRPPRIGLFYDTSTLQWNHRNFHADLSTPEGKEWLYVSARDFFSLIPPELWATIEGRPILWLYSAAFAKRQDPEALDSLRREFEEDFGVEPFVVKEVSWQGRADLDYAWGAALKANLHGVAAVGPGYDHSAVPGRTPLVRDREGGDFYRCSWEFILSRDPARRPKVAVVETWNELHEGTEIAPTREHGRLYVELTRKYADRWRAGERVERSGPFAKAAEVSIVLGAKNRSEGLAQREHSDGRTRAVREAGKEARRTEATETGGAYIYFDVDDVFYWKDSAPLEVEFEYLDRGGAEVILEYDSADSAAPHGGAFKSLDAGRLGNSQVWKIGKVTVKDAAFTGRANGNDFRLSSPGGEIVLHRVVVRKAKQR